MQMYTSYKVADVLKEYAVVFFRLLDAGYKLQNEHYLMQARIALLPNMADGARKQFLDDLNSSTLDADDILGINDDDEATDMNKLKRLLEGK